MIDKDDATIISKLKKQIKFHEYRTKYDTYVNVSNHLSLWTPCKIESDYANMKDKYTIIFIKNKNMLAYEKSLLELYKKYLFDIKYHELLTSYQQRIEDQLVLIRDIIFEVKENKLRGVIAKDKINEILFDLDQYHTKFKKTILDSRYYKALCLDKSRQLSLL